MYEKEDDDDLVYVMQDPTEFINQIRKLVFAGFGSDALNDEELEHLVLEIDEEEMDKTLSFNECKVIAMEYLKPKKSKNKKKTKFFLTEQQFNDFVEAVNARLVSNVLTELVDEGKLESAWDSEANDFIFWVANNED